MFLILLIFYMLRRKISQKFFLIYKENIAQILNFQKISKKINK